MVAIAGQTPEEKMTPKPPVPIAPPVDQKAQPARISGQNTHGMNKIRKCNCSRASRNNP